MIILAMKTEYDKDIILQSVELDKTLLDEEWKSIKFISQEYDIFKIQKRIFEAEKKKFFSFIGTFEPYRDESHTYGSWKGGNK